MKSGEVLQVSAANFGKSEARIGSESKVSVTWKPGSNILEEVVVTALGIKREKKSLTYASETINSDQINKSGSGNPLSELSGKASGITVINSSGDPGGGTYVRLRGVTSITGDNQPLMVVDGVPIDNSINNYEVSLQEYLALNLNLEAWTLWRRTGEPALTPTAGNNGIPRRYVYPQTELSLNESNVPQGTLYAPKIFWDK